MKLIPRERSLIKATYHHDNIYYKTRYNAYAMAIEFIFYGELAASLKYKDASEITDTIERDLHAFSPIIALQMLENFRRRLKHEAE